jgi:hypothetical protein
MSATPHEQVLACWSGAGLYALGLGWAHLKRAGSGLLAPLGSSQRLSMVRTGWCSLWELPASLPRCPTIRVCLQKVVWCELASCFGRSQSHDLC